MRNWTIWMGALATLLASGSPVRAQPAAPRLAPYRISADLAEVVNRKQFQGTAEQRALLAKNLFLVTPTREEQLFFIYENNDYGNLPSFVTTDLALQLFHVFYGFTLRKIETQRLLPLVQQLTRAMLKQSQLTLEEAAPHAELREAALRNVCYFAVAARLLGEKPVALPAEAASRVATEVALVEKHGGYKLGAVFPYQLDYSQFVPRGHYSRTEPLKRYFKSMLWFGLAPFAFRRVVMPPPGKTVPSPETVRSALLLTRDLYQARQQETWARIYEPTSFFVGVADDLSPGEYRQLSLKIFGADAGLEAFKDNEKLSRFIKEGLALRAAGIQHRFRHVLGGLLPMADPKAPQLRLMGQRHVIDSEVFQRLTHPGGGNTRPRYFPAGLDVMAVLGSARARKILDDEHPELYKTRVWAGYAPERQKITEELARWSEKDWTRNLYRGWLWALQAQIRPAGEGHPSFMRSTAWEDRSLSTALASWAELRHDTILYAKQSATGAECGGDEEQRRPKGYVEPNPELYGRLLSVVKLAREGLVKRKLISATLKDRYDRFADLLLFLQRTAQKELAGQKLGAQEHEQIRIIGATVENLTLSLIQEEASGWREIRNPTDRFMAVVADVHTGGEEKLFALEEAVGPAQEILVVVPVEGKLQINRGAVFSYFEFQRPVEERLTDEAWQKLLRQGKAPAPPPWTRSFTFAPTKPQPTLKVLKYSSGC